MITMRRTFVASLLCLGLLAGACSSDSKGDATSGSTKASDGAACPVDALAKATEPVNVTFWHSMTAQNETVLKQLVEAYNTSQAKVKVTATFQGTYDDTSDKYLTALRGGDLPGIVMLEDTRTQLMLDSKSVVPAQACVDAAKYDLSDHLPVVLDGLRVGGDLAAMPFNSSTQVLFYDANDLAKAGVEPPKTLAELRTAAEKVKASGAAKTGIALDVTPFAVEQWYAKAGATIVDHENGRKGRATKATLDTPVGRGIFELLGSLVKDGLASNVGKNPTYADQLLAIGKGDASIAVQTPAALGTIYAVQAAGQFTDTKVGVAPIPGDDKGPNIAGGGALWIVGKGKSPAEIAAAWDFTRFLNEPAQQATWHVGTGYVPIRKAAVADPKVQAFWAAKPTFRVAYDSLVNSPKSDLAGPVIGPYKEVRAALTAALERMFTQGQDPDAALAQAQKEATEAIASYNERVGD
jgi:sn-glycerol 3-phosphate transport system substrate-binding protein